MQMQITVLKQIDELNRMSMVQLRKRWADLLGTDPGRLGRNYLIRRLAYRIQELAFGGLSRDARRELSATANGTPPKVVVQARKRRKMRLATGTRLLREWHGDRYEVIVKEDGFLYDSKHYKSLTAVAMTITGSRWSGNRFFGLIPERNPKRGNA